MIKLWGYIKSFLAEDFQLLYYLNVGVYLLVLLFIGYYFDLENRFLNPVYGGWLYYFYCFSALALAYLGTFVIQSFFVQRPSLPYKFWLALFFILGIQTIELSYSWHGAIADLFPADLHYLAIRSAKNLLGLVTVLLPLYLFHRLSHAKSQFYGLSLRKAPFRPYLIISVLALVVIAFSVYNGEISGYYPTYKSAMGVYFPDQEWVSVLIYELCYALDFVSIEMIYRGFMVVGLSQWLGKDAIVPMVSTYCILHLGKPLPEAISSIFGGYVLGIFAYNTRNIMGGILIHISVALGMEFFAWWLG